MSRLISLSIAFLAAMLSIGQACVAYADSISISLSPPVTGSPGDSITVFGSLTNTTSSTLYFGSDAINLTAPGTVATATDDIIVNGLFDLGPTSIAAGATLDNVDLFSVQLLSGTATYSGNSFELIGGTDVAGCQTGATDCTTLLGGTTFSINVAAPTPVPEPSSTLLIVSGIGFLLVLAY